MRQRAWVLALTVVGSLTAALPGAASLRAQQQTPALQPPLRADVRLRFGIGVGGTFGTRSAFEASASATLPVSRALLLYAGGARQDPSYARLGLGLLVGSRGPGVRPYVGAGLVADYDEVGRTQALMRLGPFAVAGAETPLGRFRALGFDTWGYGEVQLLARGPVRAPVAVGIRVAFAPSIEPAGQPHQ